MFWIPGSPGMVASALVRLCQSKCLDAITTTRSDVDCLDSRAVRDFIDRTRPDIIVIAAAKVGGIHANNTQRADFIWENLTIAANIIHAAHIAHVHRVVALGSSCIYPRHCEQPMQERHLLSGSLEPTNEPYAVAKIASIKMIESFNHQYGHRWLSLMPTNLYGPGDNYHPLNSHVLPAMIRRFHEAKERKDPTITLWGTGVAKREFLHVDDLATACLHAIDHGDEVSALPGSFLNVGSGDEVSIQSLALTIKKIVGYEGQIVWDASKPDGMLRKLLDSSIINRLSWFPSIDLESGIKSTYATFLHGDGRGIHA